MDDSDCKFDVIPQKSIDNNPSDMHVLRFDKCACIVKIDSQGETSGYGGLVMICPLRLLLNIVPTV